MKICPQCNSQNPDSGNFCPNCGMKLGSNARSVTRIKDHAGTLILLWAVIYLALFLVRFLIVRYEHSLYENGMYNPNFISFLEEICVVLTYAKLLMLIVPAFAIKNVKWRILAIIILSIPVMYTIISFLIVVLSHIP